MTLYTLRDSNIRKTWLYLAVFFAIIVLLGWFLSYYFNDETVFVFVLVFGVASGFFSYWFSDKIALSLSGAKPIKKSDNPELYRLTENLCITAGLPLPKIYIIDDKAPNAFATGRNPEHSAIAVTTGLLGKLERQELEGVVAHELSHIGNRDTLLATIVVVLVGLIVRLADIFFRSRWRSSRDDEDRGGANILFLLSIVLLVLAPILAQLLRLAISRKREFLADSTGSLLTRYPEGLASALEKISQDPNELRRASNATAHLYIANPFKDKSAGGGFAGSASWLMKLFSTHPPIKERIAILRALKM